MERRKTSSPADGWSRSSTTARLLRAWVGPRAVLRGPLLATLLATLLVTPAARAQTGVDSASSSGKGIAAGVLLGAEAVVLTEAVLGVEPRWAYLVGAGAGAVGGGIGGYFLEDNLSPKTATVLLAAGMVLAIPATVAALNASAYRPPADYIEDQAPTDEPVEDPPTAARRSTNSLALDSRLPALLGLDWIAAQETRWSLGVPAIALLDVYPAEMRLAYDLARETEVRVPLFALRY